MTSVQAPVTPKSAELIGPKLICPQNLAFVLSSLFHISGQQTTLGLFLDFKLIQQSQVLIII